ncbi:glycosyltransferase family 2 protein [Candidatus Poribacteria bacterium]|nr:glycosyltransferase family 2 protein [Candidatus Poribacteria bacterium]
MTIRPRVEIPSISVVITNYNGRRFLADCLDSVLSQTLKPVEVFVVDNASSDGSAEFLKSVYGACLINPPSPPFAKGGKLGGGLSKRGDVRAGLSQKGDAGGIISKGGDAGRAVSKGGDSGESSAKGVSLLPSDRNVLLPPFSKGGEGGFPAHTQPEIKLISMGYNAGFARATNAGIRESSGEFIALLNNDAVADSGWLERLTRPMLESEEIGFCASKMLFLWDKTRVNNAGIGITDYGLPYDRGFYCSDGPEYAGDRLVFGACGGAAMFRRKMLERTGLFDEDFFLCYDDADLSFRAQLMGYKCMYGAGAVVYHAGGATVPYHGRTARFYSCRHFIRVVARNMPGPILRQRLPAIAWFCVKNSLRSAIQNRDLTNLRGYAAGFASLCRRFGQRAETQQARTVTVGYIRSLMVSKAQMLRETSAPFEKKAKGEGDKAKGKRKNEEKESPPTRVADS